MNIIQYVEAERGRKIKSSRRLESGGRREKRQERRREDRRGGSLHGPEPHGQEKQYCSPRDRHHMPACLSGAG